MRPCLWLCLWPQTSGVIPRRPVGCPPQSGCLPHRGAPHPQCFSEAPFWDARATVPNYATATKYAIVPNYATVTNTPPPLNTPPSLNSFIQRSSGLGSGIGLQGGSGGGAGAGQRGGWCARARVRACVTLNLAPEPRHESIVAARVRQPVVLGPQETDLPGDRGKFEQDMRDEHGVASKQCEGNRACGFTLQQGTGAVLVKVASLLLSPLLTSSPAPFFSLSPLSLLVLLPCPHLHHSCHLYGHL